jgi:uncharacterized protein YjiS (DUF1127 family)
MAAFDTTPAQFDTAGSAGRIGRSVVSVFSAFVAWNETRATRAILSKLSDQELADIGLSRGDIDTIA